MHGLFRGKDVVFKSDVPTSTSSFTFNLNGVDYGPITWNDYQNTNCAYQANPQPPISSGKSGQIFLSQDWMTAQGIGWTSMDPKHPPALASGLRIPVHVRIDSVRLGFAFMPYNEKSLYFEVDPFDTTQVRRMGFDLNKIRQGDVVGLELDPTYTHKAIGPRLPPGFDFGTSHVKILNLLADVSLVDYPDSGGPVHMFDPSEVHRSDKSLKLEPGVEGVLDLDQNLVMSMRAGRLVGVRIARNRAEIPATPRPAAKIRAPVQEAPRQVTEARVAPPAAPPQHSIGGARGPRERPYAEPEEMRSDGLGRYDDLALAATLIHSFEALSRVLGKPGIGNSGNGNGNLSAKQQLVAQWDDLKKKTF